MTCPDYEGSLGRAFGLLRLMRDQNDGKVRHVVVSEGGRRLHQKMQATLISMQGENFQ